MDIDSRQRARVIQYHTNVRVKLEDGAGEARHRLRRRSDDPIPIHAEMNVEDAAILEVNELMLASPLDRSDSRPG